MSLDVKFYVCSLVAFPPSRPGDEDLGTSDFIRNVLRRSLQGNEEGKIGMEKRLNKGVFESEV